MDKERGRNIQSMNEKIGEKLNWSNILKDCCPKCGKKLHLKMVMKHGESAGFRWNRPIKCYSVNCDFIVFSEKLEAIKTKIMENNYKLLGL